MNSSFLCFVSFCCIYFLANLVPDRFHNLYCLNFYVFKISILSSNHQIIITYKFVCKSLHLFHHSKTLLQTSSEFYVYQLFSVVQLSRLENSKNCLVFDSICYNYLFFLKFLSSPRINLTFFFSDRR